MILNFSVENHRSIDQAVALSFQATALRDDQHAPLRFEQRRGEVRLLPVLGLFGANASGKTSALGAVVDFFRLVRRSHAGLGPTDRIPRRPFKLDPARLAAPTVYTCELLLGGVRYALRVAFDDQRVIEEDLYAWPEGVQQHWYRRHDGDEGWYFGPGLKGERRRLAALTRPNSLFLSAAAQHNHEQLGAVYAGLVDGLVANAFEANVPLMFSRSPLFDPARADQVRRLLRHADLGVQDFRVVSKRLSREALTEPVQHILTASPWGDLQLSPAPDDLHQLHLQHRGRGEPLWLEPEEESDGTVALINHLHQALSALDQGALWVIDELDRSLHGDLAMELLGLFTSPRSNPKGAQVLFTTHDTRLLRVLRRDEAIMVDKGADGATRLIPLSDYKVRKREDIERAYEEGRTGGRPKLLLPLREALLVDPAGAC